MSILSIDEARQAARIGLARAISEAGLTPSQAEAKVAALPILPSITGPEHNKVALSLTPALDLIKKISLTMIIGGAGAGAIAGHLHHKVDRAMDGENDPEGVAMRKKTDGYHQMTADLKQTQMAGQPGMI